jgi:hypothetical protein
MPGLVPGIHVFFRGKQTVDGRAKPGHDERWSVQKDKPGKKKKAPSGGGDRTGP